jgi:predicted NUDIX family NTP pyrophosphohydrolase
LEPTKRRYPQLAANSPKKRDTTPREISCRSARHGSRAARSFKRGPSEGDRDPALIRSNTFEMEWPPRSGRRGTFPEIDRAAWFGSVDARRKILKGQTVFVDRLLEALGV